MTVFATLPASATSDGALAFDDVGQFGSRLVASTGRSGGAEPAGGTVYTIDSSGDVQQVGTYNGPGVRTRLPSLRPGSDRWRATRS